MRRLPLVAAVVVPLLASVPPAASAHPAPPCRAGHVALTFDDGPSPSNTPKLVSSLRALDVPATFFMVGSRVDAAPATARLVERSGYLVGDHSYLHEDMTHQTTEQIEATIENTSAALDRAGVHPTDLVRPPYGAVDQHVLDAIHAQHDVPVLWTVDPRDWESGDAAQIAARILAQLRPGDNVVLQHDGVENSPSSIAAVPAVVREARRRGFCFAGLDERGRVGFPRPAAHLSVVPADRHVREGRTLHVTVSLDAEAGEDTSLRLLLRSRGASLRDDLVRPRSLVRLPAGRLGARVDIPISRDDLTEGKERFELRLADGEGVRPERGKTTIVIEDVGG